MKCESTIKHSQFSKKIRSYITTLLFITLFWCFWALQVQAQMFSVGNSGPRFNIPQTEVYAGIQPMEVTYQGSSSITLGQGRNAFNFEGPIIRLGYESPTLDLFLGTGGQISGIDGASYFDIGGNIDFGLSVLRTEPLSIQIPFRIASRFTNITSDQAFQSPGVERFRFGSLTAGAGARILGRPFDNFRIEAGAIPSYGFSFASGGFFGGSMSSVAGFGRLYFDRLFEDVGISVGYKYDYRNYDVDEDIYDYKMKGHSLELGITF